MTSPDLPAACSQALACDRVPAAVLSKVCGEGKRVYKVLLKATAGPAPGLHALLEPMFISGEQMQLHNGSAELFRSRPALTVFQRRPLKPTPASEI